MAMETVVKDAAENVASQASPSVISKTASDAGASAAQTPAQTQAQQSIKIGGKEYANYDEVGKAYESLQSEHGKWTQKYGDLEKQYREAAPQAELAQKWSQWWKNVQPLWGDDVESLLRKKLGGGAAAAPQQAQQGQQQGQGQGQAQNNFEGWEMLPAQEQYQRLSQYIQGTLQQQYDGKMQQLAQAMQGHLQQREQWYQSYLTNHLGLMRKALERKLVDPKFDVDAVMEHAARAMSGQVDPLELGYQLINAQDATKNIEAARELARTEAYAQAKRDMLAEQENKKMELVPSNGSAPVFKFSPGSSQGGRTVGLGTRRQNAAEAMYKKFGADLFTG